ncbi:GNAT family N-acetyltransferase [candidate division WOR-3 bacterium]|nr:GNAT family N-acetyltransferase [candidate division WOR-3 bacterium]
MKPGSDFKSLMGKNVVLKPRDERLLGEYYQKRFRPEVLHWADTWPRIENLSELRNRFQVQELSPSEFRLWIFTLSDKLIGEVSLFDIDLVKGKAEFGIVIFDPAYWGQGLGTEAARLFLAYACRFFKINVLYLSTSQENKRAIRSFEKLGFRISGRVASEEEKRVKMEADTSILRLKD